jgi:ACS family hexuronate transporter-like MFS transporter
VNQPATRYRWIVLSIFVLCSAINYLDRQALATLAPLVRAEFGLSNRDIGLIVTAFSVAYAASAPLAGLLIDAAGLNRAISVAIAVWSCAGIGTGFTRGLGGLVGCRAVLGLSEAAGVPAAGKAIHQYLRPGERALGNALNQAGVSLGMVAAPPLATWIAVTWGWRHAFIATGALGLLWIPLWRSVARLSGASPVREERPAGSAGILRAPRLWAFVCANALGMIGYSLWTNWTTLYLVDAHGLTLVQAAWYAWIPPLFFTVGGFGGGWLSLRWIERGLDAVAARTRACGAGALLALSTAAVPLLPGAGWASAGISLSVLAISAFSVNMYTIPLDTFGGARAAFAISLLVCSYGVIQAIVSPAFGAVIDAYGYAPLCVAVAFTPLAAYGVLRWTESANS